MWLRRPRRRGCWRRLVADSNRPTKWCVWFIARRGRRAQLLRRGVAATRGGNCIVPARFRTQPKANWELAMGSAPAIFARMSDAAAPAQTPSKAAIFLRRLITSVILWTVILAALFSGKLAGLGWRVSAHHRLSRADRAGGVLRPRRKARPRLLQMVRPARRRAAHGGDISGTHRQNRHTGFAGARERF